jgi:hypothetical protein
VTDHVSRQPVSPPPTPTPSTADVGGDGLEVLGRERLATLVRELLLCGHLIDRATMPHVIGSWGREEMRDIAIDEWMGASPVYTRRMQRLLGFVGTDVTKIFKGMQLDIGAPPQFMDFRYTVHDAEHGEFHLDHCGALMDVEPMGEEYVVTMCHDIEDPTFDATACATNPRARMRPVHRPPRMPADRQPHCAWTVTIEPDATPLPEPEMAVLVADTPAARLPLTPIVDTPTDAGLVVDSSAIHAAASPSDDVGGAEGEGATDYAGTLVDDLDFASFSTGTLVALAEEVALQGQLLSLSGLLSIAGRHGEDAARVFGWHQLTGWAGLTATRLHAALGQGDTLADAAALLRLHPALRPRTYVSMTMHLDASADTLTVNVLPCPALDEPSGLTWAALLASTSVDASGTDIGRADTSTSDASDSTTERADGEPVSHSSSCADVAPLSVIVQAVDARLRVVRTATEPGAVATFAVVRGDGTAAMHVDEQLARFSTGAEFTFADEGTRVELRRTGGPGPTVTSGSTRTS